jgi:hypothetical protein
MGSALGSLFGANDSSQTSPYASGISGQEGVDQYQEDLNRKNSIYQGQNNLAQALQAQMNGTGPNPAQTQYLQNVQNNIANSQGMIASQRGLNPALAARMGVNTASNLNQQGSLGSALLQQNQQIAATSNLGNLYGQMQGGNLNYIGEQDGLNNSANKLNAGVAAGNANRNAGIAGGLINAGGGLGAAAVGAAHGALIKGNAKVSGDSPTNDTVPTMLSPGEIVIPRSHAHDPEKAKEFVDHLLENEKKKKVGYGDVLKSRQKKAA